MDSSGYSKVGADWYLVHDKLNEFTFGCPLLVHNWYQVRGC